MMRLALILAAFLATASLATAAEPAPNTKDAPAAKPATPAPAAKPAAPAAPAAAPAAGKEVTTPSGLKYTDLKVGDGAVAKSGDRVSVHYTGWLTSGAKFDSSVDRNQPFQFQLGRSQVIKGWDEGVAGMKVGGKRKLTIPAELGYGARGAGDRIPPNSVLIFDVELLGIQQ